MLFDDEAGRISIIFARAYAAITGEVTVFTEAAGGRTSRKTAFIGVAVGVEPYKRCGGCPGRCCPTPVSSLTLASHIAATSG